MHPAADDPTPPTAKRISRPLLIGGVIAALVIAVGVPATVLTVRAAEITDIARGDAAGIAAAHDRAVLAAADHEEALVEAAAFATATLAPAVEALGDGSQFSADSAAELAGTLEELLGAQSIVEQPESEGVDAETATAIEGAAFDVTLSTEFVGGESIEELLVERYHASDDHEVDRLASAAEQTRLTALASELTDRAELLRAVIPRAQQQLAGAAEAGVVVGEATLAAHDRAVDEPREQLAVFVTSLREFAATVGAEGAAESTALPAAEIFGGYTAAAEAVRASHASVIAAEQAAAARPAPPSGGGGGGSRVCSKVGFSGSIIIYPC